MTALKAIGLRRGESNGYRYTTQVVAEYVDGTEDILFDSPSYLDACRFLNSGPRLPEGERPRGTAQDIRTIELLGA